MSSCFGGGGVLGLFGDFSLTSYSSLLFVCASVCVLLVFVWSSAMVSSGFLFLFCACLLWHSGTRIGWKGTGWGAGIKDQRRPCRLVSSFCAITISIIIYLFIHLFSVVLYYYFIYLFIPFWLLGGLFVIVCVLYN